MQSFLVLQGLAIASAIICDCQLHCLSLPTEININFNSVFPFQITPWISQLPSSPASCPPHRSQPRTKGNQFPETVRRPALRATSPIQGCRPLGRVPGRGPSCPAACARRPSTDRLCSSDTCAPTQVSSRLVGFEGMRLGEGRLKLST